MKLILLGPPGAGKGTQAEILAKQLGVPQISTGVLLRSAAKNGTLVGLKAKSFMDAGNLVPDDIIIGIVKERLTDQDCRDGYIFDGVPRTIMQAQAFDEQDVIIDVVISIEIADEAIEKRLGGRRSCPGCGTVYHIETKPPLTSGVCDFCGAEIITRDDDDAETIRKRLLAYHKETEPLKDYYRAQNKLRIVNGDCSIAETAAEVQKILDIN